MEVLHRGTEINDPKKRTKKKTQNDALAIGRPTERFHAVPIGTNIETEALRVASPAERSRRYGANEKNRILVNAVLECGNLAESKCIR